MIFVALFLAWLSGIMSMAAVSCFSAGKRGEGVAYVLTIAGLMVPALVRVLS